MDTEIKNAVKASDQDAQYDDRAKRILGQKYILAHILVKSVDEFKDMNPKDVVKYIEGDPIISKVPVEAVLAAVALFGLGLCNQIYCEFLEFLESAFLKMHLGYDLDHDVFSFHIPLTRSVLLLFTL